ncbi:MAG TPA: tetratricopeptide repeat protein [Planctomycetota bacterium]|nr:tetratricopeptide repeat protein [Planctomycetota bacterium]
MLRLLCLALIAAAASAADVLDDAKEKFAAGDFQGALAAADEVPADDAAYVKARYLAGEIRLMLGDPAEAEKAFRAALGKKPGAEPLLTGLGRALLERDQAAEALRVLEEAVKAAPDSARALCFLGIARMRTTEGRKGRKEIEKAAGLAKDDPEIARAAVVAYLKDEDTDDAGKAARRFAKAQPKSPMGPFLVAVVQEREKGYDDAIASYEAALKLDDSFLDAHKNLAILCIAQNPLYTNTLRTEKAQKHFERYFELGGRDEHVREIWNTLQQFLKSR